MSRSGRPTDDKPLPPLYAMTHGGIEAVAADEITRDLGGEVKKTARGLVVFRVDQVTDAVLKLQTTEDVFLLAWGSDSLTYRPADLDTIRTWTAKKQVKQEHCVREVRSRERDQSQERGLRPNGRKCRGKIGE